MRVLHINNNYLGTRLHQELMEYLNEYRIDNHVFVPINEKTESVIIPGDYVNVIACYKRNMRYIYSLKQRFIINAAKRIYDFSNFDLTHAYTLFNDGNVSLFIKKKFKIPYVVAVRSTDIDRFFKKYFWLRRHGITILQEAETVFFLSEETKQSTYNKYLSDVEKKELNPKTRVIPNGINKFWFDNTPKEDLIVEKSERILKNRIHVLYAGKIDSNKNIATTLKALDILKKEGFDVVYTVVGKIYDNQEYVKLFNYPFAKYVEAKPMESLIQYYRDADIFVMPSRSETFGLVYAEAMSQGLPVIYTRGQGFDGQFKDGEVGYSVDCDKPEEIADRLKDIIDNYRAISNNCINFSKLYDWDIISQEYVSVYKEIVIK